jgi:tetratricopeptide (TPR) repeat protein
VTSAGTGLDHEVADAYRELGDRYRDDDAADAEVFYRRSLRFRPDVAGVHARLAAALCKLNRFGEAEDHLSRARSLDPHHDETSCLWADLAVLNGRVPEALQVYRTALLNGASARLRTEYADLLHQLGFGRDAEAEYRRALEAADTVEARVNLGLVYVERGEAAAALEQFDEALRLDGSSLEAALNRANALVELGRLDAAATGYAALLEDATTRGPALWGLAAVHERRGDAVAARRCREAAIDVAPGLADGCGDGGRVGRGRG